MSKLVIGNKITPPQGDFGGDNYAIKVHTTETNTKFKINKKVLDEVVNNPNGSALFVPVYNKTQVAYFVGFEYVDNPDSKKLPAGKISKTGIFSTSKDTIQDVVNRANDEGLILLKPIGDDMGVVIPTQDSGMVNYKPAELAGNIKVQFNIELKTFKVYEVMEAPATEVTTADAEPQEQEETQSV